MSLARKTDHKHTYADIDKWPEDERWELINGAAYNMTPPPSRIHQEISRNLLRIFANYLTGKTCKVYSAPFGVWFVEKSQDTSDADTYVEPDIVVICDKNKLTDKGCAGAPDLIIEVTSPATAGKDMGAKLNLYERNGVKEYWVVHPTDQIIMVFQLIEGKYGKPTTYSPAHDEESKVKVSIFEDLLVDLPEVFHA